MSNGVVCCLYGVCCPPGSEQQAKALADFLEGEAGGKDESYLGLARILVKNFGIVPRAVADSIVEQYGPEFAKLPPPKQDVPEKP